MDNPSETMFQLPLNDSQLTNKLQEEPIFSSHIRIAVTHTAVYTFDV